MFRGREGLKYELASMGGEPIITSQDEISLLFKTRKSSALLYYNGKYLRYKPFMVLGRGNERNYFILFIPL